MKKKINKVENSDIEKKLEVLKIKQKLLIDSIKKKIDREQDESVIELNSKVDFLIKIFSKITDVDEKNKKDFELFKQEVKTQLEDISGNLNTNIKYLKAEIKGEVLDELKTEMKKNKFNFKQRDKEEVTLEDGTSQELPKFDLGND